MGAGHQKSGGNWDMLRFRAGIKDRDRLAGRKNIGHIPVTPPRIVFGGVAGSIIEQKKVCSIVTVIKFTICPGTEFRFFRRTGENFKAAD